MNGSLYTGLGQYDRSCSILFLRKHSSFCYYSPILKKVGYTGFGLSVIASDRPSGFFFRSISSEQIDRISPNFGYALISIRSSLGLLHIIFLSFVIALRPLIDVRISLKILFPLNILRTN